MRYLSILVIVLAGGCAIVEKPKTQQPVVPQETGEQRKWVKWEQAGAALQNPEEERKAEGEKTAAAGDTISRMDAAVAEMISIGGIYSVDPSIHEVRIDPSLWALTSLEQKRNTLYFFSAYFGKKHNPPSDGTYVDILSSRNDKVLAKFTLWGGPKILE